MGSRLVTLFGVFCFGIALENRTEKQITSQPTELHLKNTSVREHENDKILLHILLCLEFYSNEK